MSSLIHLGFGELRLIDLVIDREALCTLLRTIVAPNKDAQFKGCSKKEVFYNCSYSFGGVP